MNNIDISLEEWTTEEELELVREIYGCCWTEKYQVPESYKNKRYREYLAKREANPLWAKHIDNLFDTFMLSTQYKGEQKSHIKYQMAGLMGYLNQEIVKSED